MMLVHRARLFMLPIAGLLALAACNPSSPCDPGYYEVHDTCYPNRTPLDAGNDARVGESDEDGGEPTEPPSDPYEGFGEACEERSDCPNDLFCFAPQLPMCTQVNCLDDPSICPPDWTCFDTTGVSPDPSVMSVCLML